MSSRWPAGIVGCALVLLIGGYLARDPAVGSTASEPTAAGGLAHPAVRSTASEPTEAGGLAHRELPTAVPRRSVQVEPAGSTVRVAASPEPTGRQRERETLRRLTEGKERQELGDLPRAIELFRQIVDEHPDSGFAPEASSSLAWCLYEQGDVPGAVQEMARAVDWLEEGPPTAATERARADLASFRAELVE